MLSMIGHANSSLANVKVEGPISGYLFEDTRECSDGRILMGVTNDNTESIILKVLDPEGGKTFVENLSITPGLTVVPWRTTTNYQGRFTGTVVNEQPPTTKVGLLGL